MTASVFHSRVRRDRKGRSDRMADCQDWQDIDSENAMNEIETSAEVVDGRQKVPHTSPPLHSHNVVSHNVFTMEG